MPTPDPPQVRHGASSGEIWHQKRKEKPCPECRAYTKKRYTAWRKRNQAILAADPTDARHGTYLAYTSFGCRCERCRQAGRDYRAGIRPRSEPLSGDELKVSAHLDPALLARLDRAAEEEDASRAEMIRRFVAEGLTRRDRWKRRATRA